MLRRNIRRLSTSLQAPRLPRPGRCAQAAAVLLVSGLAVPASLLVSGRAWAYSSPFQLNVTAPQDWLSDFQARTDLLLQHTIPPQAQWTSANFNALQLGWGPTNPQLYSVDVANIGAPALVGELNSDRTGVAYNAPLNQPPSGVPFLGWATQRLMAAAQALIGTAYQHLHLPQFNPAAVSPASNFTWNSVSSNAMLQSTQQLLIGQPGSQLNPYKGSYGMAAPGIDCTDFTAYIYSLALGYQLHSGTFNQVMFPTMNPGQVGGPAQAIVLDSSGSPVQPTFFYGPNYGTDTPNSGDDLKDLMALLQPGDMLYIGNRQGILHVVTWLGPLGTNADGSPSSVPLVISSHDNTPAIFTTQDISFAPGPGLGFPSDGQIDPYLPPPGVQILPFTNQNWFYSNFQVAMRVLPSQAPASVPAPATPLWAFALIGQQCRRLRRRALQAQRSAAGQPAIPTGCLPGRE